jgi:ATP-dependent RNA helicase DHX57
MPKNPHPPRGGPAKKPAAKTILPAEDTSYIVFGDGKDKKKKKGDNSAKVAENDANKTSKGKGKAPVAGQPEDVPKPPTAKQIVGGASWTGKVPVTMLSEHLQKQQWNKADYRQDKVGETFSAYVVLSKKNAKTQEVTKLPPSTYKIPPELVDDAKCPTAVEARNFAAAYTLFRLASTKNLHMMMPPQYRDFWKGKFTEIKKKDESEGRAWMYEADPFLGFSEREKAREIAAREREKKQKEREQAAKNPLPGMSLLGSRGPSPSTGRSNLLKGWERVPKIELGKKTRKEVERLIRRDAIWGSHAGQIDPKLHTKIVQEVSELGFRRSHVEEAIEVCKDREEVIEWLLIHVPEDDLPSWSLPEGYVAGVSMASSNLKREGAINRLAAAGYARELCEEAYDGQRGNEDKAAAYLQTCLLRPTETPKDIANEISGTCLTNELSLRS